MELWSCCGSEPQPGEAGDALGDVEGVEVRLGGQVSLELQPDTCAAGFYFVLVACFLVVYSGSL